MNSRSLWRYTSVGSTEIIKSTREELWHIGSLWTPDIFLFVRGIQSEIDLIVSCLPAMVSTCIDAGKRGIRLEVDLANKFFNAMIRLRSSTLGLGYISNPVLPYIP